MKKNAPALPAKDHEGIGAKLIALIIQSIGKSNEWQVCPPRNRPGLGGDSHER